MIVWLAGIFGTVLAGLVWFMVARSQTSRLFARHLRHVRDGLEGIRLVGSAPRSALLNNEGPRIIGGKLGEVADWLQRFEAIRPRIENLPDGLARSVEQGIAEAERVHAAATRYARPYIEGAVTWVPGGQPHIWDSWARLMQDVEHVVGVLDKAIMALRTASAST